MLEELLVMLTVVLPLLIGAGIVLYRLHVHAKCTAEVELQEDRIVVS